MFNVRQLNVIEYCAEEVGRQYNHRYANPKQAAAAVGWMLNAWDYAFRAAQGDTLTTEHVRFMGWLIEPGVNKQEWRTTGVYVGPRKCPEWQEVPRLMERWGMCLQDSGMMAKLARAYARDQEREGGLVITPEMEEAFLELPTAAYFAFAHIHPFADGNGRTGKVILNWLRGTPENPTYGLENPEWPFNFWRITNP